MEKDQHLAGDDETLVTRAYRAIEELIVTQDLQPGAAVSEGYLSKRLGIGRTPVREALHRLEREGLVLISPRRGIFVTEIRVDAQLRLLEVRRELERLLARRAASFASARQRSTFGQLSVEMRQAAASGDEIEFLRLDLRFNKWLMEASDNEYVSAAIGLMSGLSRRFWYRYFDTLGDWPKAACLHAAIADAISQGMPDAAEAASDELMDYLEELTRAVFEQGR
ncbi:GntR family transcriptional regulator [Aurantiacibacter suaedae]|uniref:GntR family transcriptional regulator n=1 Tax=Aurantiacibacter suaedae TaxID=2545755 RepID=UPI0010F8B931|nr:GntR family transcriptional regulator [Aurantiacibacter suaedae]